MTMMKQTEFAELHGVSRKTVTMWKRRGWLVFQGDLVDVEASNALLKKYRRDGTNVVTQNGLGNKAGNKNKAVTTDPPESLEDAAAQILAMQGATMNFDEARRVKENYLALLNKLEYEEQLGSLIELDLAQQIFFEEFRSQRDAWLNWPMRIGPLLAADLGLEADRVTEALTAYVHSQIADLGEPEANFEKREG